VVRTAIAAAAAVVALLAYAVAPRGADLRAFTPPAIASIETASWRHYYEKRYLALAGDLYRLSASQFRFSPWDSVRLAADAARAAHDFQGTHSRAEAERALPPLRAYFGVLATAVPGLDVDAAARAELDWWQARREAAAPADYGLRIARVTTLLYRVDNAATRAAGVSRARAMALRDQRGDAITDADWAAIERQLRTAYQELKQGLQ
jgi:hypothetical protein